MYICDGCGSACTEIVEVDLHSKDPKHPYVKLTTHVQLCPQCGEYYSIDMRKFLLRHEMSIHELRENEREFRERIKEERKNKTNEKQFEEAIKKGKKRNA